MNKTILLGWNQEYSAKQSFGVHITTACILVIMGMLKVMRDSENSVSERFGVVMFILAVGSVIHGLTAYTKISKWSPKVSAQESHLLIKEKLFSSAIKIDWNKIQSIQIAPYQIVFSMVDGTFDFSYNSTADTSIQIKSAIREIAAYKQIQIVDA